MRFAVVALVAAGLFVLAPTSAGAEVPGCGGDQPLGALTCTVTGPAMIDGTAFAGDGGSSAQYQWVGATMVASPGTLTLEYTYSGIFNTLFARIGMRLTINQPDCVEEPHESRRNWVDPSAADGVAQQISLRVSCAGPVDYIITSRAATWSLGGSFVGNLMPPTLTFTAAAVSGA
jgi:hypothetical protein